MLYVSDSNPQINRIFSDICFLLPDASLKKLAKLLACNFRALESEYSEVDNLLQALRDVPMIPLADGRVVALGTEGVFFPLSEETHKGSTKISSPSYSNLHSHEQLK